MTFLPEKVTFFALFLRMKKARKPDKINVFGLAGDSETRTHDPLNAIQVLSQLSYTPKRCRYLITYLINMQVELLDLIDYSLSVSEDEFKRYKNKMRRLCEKNLLQISRYMISL